MARTLAMESTYALFELCPISLWLEDLSEVKVILDGLPVDGPGDLEAYLEAHPEVVDLCVGKVRVLDVNPAGLALHQAPDQASLLRGLRSTFVAESQPAFRSELVQFAAGVDSHVTQTQVRTLGGELRDVAVHCARDPAFPDWSRVYLAVIDRTEELRLSEQLLATQRSESLGVLAGGVAHDFNNILMAILGHVNLALEDLPPEASVRGNLLAIQTAAQRAAGLSQQMLAYAGRGHLLLEEVDINETVRDLALMLEVSISQQANLVLELAEDPPLTMADAGQLQQVVLNLISNAGEALADGEGQITIRTGLVNLAEDELLQARGPSGEPPPPAGSFAFVEVSDDGCGMSPEVTKRVFDPFFTTKFTGRGLGMAAVLGIASGHGGVLHLWTEEGRGTRIRLALPALTHPMSASPTPATTEDPPTKLKGTVLIADDERPVRLVLATMLRRLGLEVLEADDGYEAIQLFEIHRERIRVALIDLVMPRLDGAHALRELSQLDPDLPIVLISGYDLNEVTEALDGHEPAGFLQKPFDMDELHALLRRVLES